jgi:hypothetical protein
LKAVDVKQPEIRAGHDILEEDLRFLGVDWNDPNSAKNTIQGVDGVHRESRSNGERANRCRDLHSRPHQSTSHCVPHPVVGVGKYP